MQKNIKIVLIFFIIIFSIMLINAGADEINHANAFDAKTISFQNPLSLKNAIKIAIKNNPELKAVTFSEKAAESNIGEAKANFLPVITFTETFNRTTIPMWTFGTLLNQGRFTKNDFNPSILNDPDPINNFNSVLSVSMPVYSGGRIYNSFKQAELNKSIAILVHKQRKQAIIAKTALIYTRLLLAQKNLEVILKSLETAYANLKLVQSRYDSGFSVKSDLLRAKVRIADLVQQKLSAINRIKIVKSYLNTVMGIPLDSPVNAISYFGNSFKPKGKQADFISKAIKNRPELQILKLKQKVALKGIKIAESAHLPSINIFANYENNTENFNGGNNDYSVGAVMQVNLFKGFGINSRIHSAKLSLRRIRELRKSMKLGVETQTREAWLNLQTAWKSIDVADSALKQAAENLRIVKNRYKNGVVTIISLLDAELADHQARTNHYRAIYNYQLAGIRLALASGTINDYYSLLRRK